MPTLFFKISEAVGVLFKISNVFRRAVCVCVCVFTCVYIHVCISMYICVNVQIYTRIYVFMYVYEYVYVYSPIGPGDPGEVIPKTQKAVLDASLLNTQHYKIQIKGKAEQSRERCRAPYISE